MMERNKDFDIAKGIASYLVVLGHLLSQLGDSKVIIITFCHMPCFFLISGYFMYFSIYKYSGIEFVKRKFYSLFIPYIVWSSISFAANILTKISNKEMVREEFVAIFLHARSMWFLIEIFISMIVLLISICIAKRIKVNPYLVSTATWIIMSLCVPDDIFSFFKFKWLFPFMVIGYLLAERKIQDMGKFIILRGGVKCSCSP